MNRGSRTEEWPDLRSRACVLLVAAAISWSLFGCKKRAGAPAPAEAAAAAVAAVAPDVSRVTTCVIDSGDVPLPESLRELPIILNAALCGISAEGAGVTTSEE